MAILLCSNNDSVRQKWFAALKDTWQVHQVATVKELFIVLKRFPIETILLHRGSIAGSELNEICANKGGSKIFLFSDRPDDSEGVACLQLGCVGYANTYIAPLRLKAAIEAVESGLIWVGSSLMNHLIKGLSASGKKTVEEKADKPVPSQFASLSNREYQIAWLVAEGLQNNEIATRLEISERTVKAHLSSIYTKTQTKGRLSLALLLKKG